MAVSWDTRHPTVDQHWATPHRALPLPLFLLVAATLAVLFVALLSLGQTVMCAWHDQGLRYCPGYEQTVEVQR